MLIMAVDQGGGEGWKDRHGHRGSRERGERFVAASHQGVLVPLSSEHTRHAGKNAPRTEAMTSTSTEAIMIQIKAGDAISICSVTDGSDITECASD